MTQTEYNPQIARNTRRRRRQLQRRQRRIALLLGLALVFALVLGRWVVGQSGTGGSTGGILSGSKLVAAVTGANAESGEDSDKLTYIRAHPELYPEDLLELAEKNAEALDYVYQYPALSGQTQTIDLSDEAAGDTVPLLLQWDTRWGYEPYGSGLIGYTGCGPTCLSMVALYLTGNPGYTPIYVANYAEENGYYVSGSGTAWTLMSEGCTAFGLTSTELPLDEGRMIAALENGEPIICSMGPGDFTDNGHYIVLTGYDNGSFTVNDPNSRENSSRTWTFAELSGQIRNLWAFEAA
ncbi:MAG: C39 family peptidase [Oscillospiraceae bacterium]|nr:C39 family peptidase [Oscillospiraceae bacterium]